MRGIGRDPGAAKGEKTALLALANEAGGNDVGTFSTQGLRLMRWQFRVLPGRRFALSQFRQLWNAGSERIEVDLPRSLDFLYHLLRVPMIMSRGFRRIVANLRA